jgi:hypothetical protein
MTTVEKASSIDSEKGRVGARDENCPRITAFGAFLG